MRQSGSYIIIVGKRKKEVNPMQELVEVEWKLELEEFTFAGCMTNHVMHA